MSEVNSELFAESVSFEIFLGERQINDGDVNGGAICVSECVATKQSRVCDGEIFRTDADGVSLRSLSDR